MPTYQTTPYMPWVFPGEAYHMNKVGMKPLRPAPLHNKLDLLPYGGSEVQTLFASHAHKVVHDRLRNNERKEKGMLGHLKMNERSQRYVRPASRSSVPNGIFHGSPMEYVTSAGLRGGVITTKEGQEWLAKRLKQRAQEYGELSSGNFGPRPPKIDVSPYNTVDTLLQSAFTAFTAGSFSSGLNDTLNQLLQALIKAGATISSSQLTTYAQAIGQMIQTTRPFEGTFRGQQRGIAFEPDEKKLRAIDAVNLTLKVIDSAIKEIARVIYEPLSTRQQVMDQLGSRLLGRQIAQYRPEFAGEERMAAAQAARESEFPLGRVPGRTTELLPAEQAPEAPEEFDWAAGQGSGRRRRHWY